MQPGTLHLALQAVEIAGGDRHDRGVEDGRRRALEFARLGIDRVRQREVGRDPGERGRHRLLVRGVGVGVQQRDGDALDPGRADGGRRRGEGGRARLQHRPAGMVHALGEADPALRRHLRRRAGQGVEAVEVLAPGAADVEHVLEPVGGDQRHRLDPVLDDGVGDERRAVDEVRDLGGIEARGGECRLDAGDGIGAPGRHLDRAHFAGRGVQRHQVGEGAADVDADLPAGFSTHWLGSA